MDPEPQPGDLIEIFRASYQHWGVYVGEGDIVHFVNPTGLPSSSGSQNINPTWICRAQVKKEKLKDVVGKDNWQINNKLDTIYRPRPTKQIVKEANSLVGEKRLYSVHMRNCEHFATELRYGKATSLQVTKAAVGLAAVGLAAVGLAAVGGAAVAGPLGAVVAAVIASFFAKNAVSMSTSSS